MPSLITKIKPPRITKSLNNITIKDTFTVTELGNGNTIIEEGGNCYSTNTSTLPNGDTMTLWGGGSLCNNKGLYQEQLNKSLKKYLH